ncbi:hypothetical protein D3C85_14760 [compost metagenome]
MENEELVLAEGLKEKLTAHLIKGYRLSQCTSLESNDIVNFNSIADHLTDGLAEQCSMEDFTSDIRERIVSMEGLLDKLKGFIFGKKKEAVKERSEDDIHLWDKLKWVNETLPKLVKNFEEKEGSVTVIERYSPAFSRFDSIATDLAGDIVEYRKMHTSAKPAISKCASFIDKLDRDMKKFYGNTDKLEEFDKFVLDAIKNQPKGYIHSFKAPSRNFVAYSNTPFVEFNKYTKRDSFKWAPVKLSGREVEVNIPTKKQLDGLVDSLVGLSTLYFELFELNEELPIGVDGTDPPWRGYWNISDVLNDNADKLDFFHPVFEESNFIFLSDIRGRLEYLISALVHYLKKAL